MTKILICDDHPIVASGLVGISSEISDFQIVGIINTAREIAPSIHQLKPDIVFLDINMDGENMVEQISVFKDIRPASSIIIFSSYNLPSLVTRAFLEGADAYLLKSSSRHEILNACTAIDQHQKFIGLEVNIRKSDRLQITGKGDPPLDKFEALHRLTERELAVFQMVAEGKTELEIAELLYISKHTVHTHRKNLMLKLGLHSSADFVRFWVEIGQ